MMGRASRLPVDRQTGPTCATPCESLRYTEQKYSIRGGISTEEQCFLERLTSGADENRRLNRYGANPPAVRYFQTVAARLALFDRRALPGWVSPGRRNLKCGPCVDLRWYPGHEGYGTGRRQSQPTFLAHDLPLASSGTNTIVPTGTGLPLKVIRPDNSYRLISLELQAGISRIRLHRSR